MASLLDHIDFDSRPEGGPSKRDTVDAAGSITTSASSAVAPMAIGDVDPLIGAPAGPVTSHGAAEVASALAALPTHLTIIPTFDSSVTGDPVIATDYTNDVNLVIQDFESAITTPITVDIDFGWGEVHGIPLAGTTAVDGSVNSVLPLSYGQFYADLQGLKSGSPLQQTAFATLPTSDPTGGTGTFDLSTAQATALGVYSNPTITNGWVGLNDMQNFFWTENTAQPDAYNAISALTRRIADVLGAYDLSDQSNTYTLLDFFRYTALDGGSTDPPGTAAGSIDQPFSSGYSASSQSYFSDDGKTITLPYDTPQEIAKGQPIGSWASSVTADSFSRITLGTVGTISATDWQELNVVGYSLAAAACFAEGTTILTATGPVAVERLAVGDFVPCVSGRLAHIVWIGRRTLEPARHPRPREVNPVRIRAGAFGHAPQRDLVLSPDHAVLVDGALIPVRHLANGDSIAPEARRRVTYWHIELDRHDAVIAEGLACETYLDTGNRSAFDGEAALDLHPEFAQARAEAIWEAQGCAEILTDPMALPLRRAHTRLLAIARGAA